eukprot:m.164005 g.164005  ORF g.164005 m.164005 type:complete len:441 (-) comp13419_c0_seq3:216-1538(-)
MIYCALFPFFISTLRWSCLYIIPLGWYSAIRMYFQVQSVVLPSVIVSVVAIFINIGFNSLFIHGSGNWKGLGFIGSPLASTATMFAQLLLFLLYTVWWKGYHKKTWPGWHLKEITWKRFKVFFKMAVSCGLALTADEGVFQVLFLISGTLPTHKIAGLGVAFQWINFVWGLWWGIGLATMIRLGHNLGAGKPRRARVAFLVGYMLSYAVLVVIAALVLIFSEYLGYPFSSDSEVIAASKDLAIYLSGCIVVYCLGASILVSIEATGRYLVVLLMQVILSLGVTLPLGYVFCFVLGYEAAGLLVGITLGDGLKGVLSFCVMYFVIDWKEESKKAIARAEQGSDSNVGHGDGDGNGNGNGDGSSCEDDIDADMTPIRANTSSINSVRRHRNVVSTAIDSTDDEDDMDELSHLLGQPLINVAAVKKRTYSTASTTSLHSRHGT